MNKTKFLCHLGGITFVFIAILIMAAIVLTPLSWYPWLMLGIVGMEFAVFLYVLGYYCVQGRINGVQ